MPVKPPVKRGLTKRGAPTKRNDEVVERMLRVAKTGLPTKFIATAGGISRETLSEWRAADPALNQRIEEARMEGVERRWQLIAKAAEAAQPNSWLAAAWMLERSHAEAFSTPAVQLGVAIQNNSQTTVNNVLVITAEQGEALTKRSKQIDAELDASTRGFLERRSQAGGTGRDPVTEIEGELVQGPITLPPSPAPSWWRSLSTGSPSRPISVEAATYVLKTIATTTLGAAGSAAMQLTLEDPVVVGDVWGGVSNIQGGWEALRQRGEG